MWDTFSIEPSLRYLWLLSQWVKDSLKMSPDNLGIFKMVQTFSECQYCVEVCCVQYLLGGGGTFCIGMVTYNDGYVLSFSWTLWLRWMPTPSESWSMWPRSCPGCLPRRPPSSDWTILSEAPQRSFTGRPFKGTSHIVSQQNEVEIYLSYRFMSGRYCSLCILELVTNNGVSHKTHKLFISSLKTL